jgi:hypothetical protein
MTASDRSRHSRHMRLRRTATATAAALAFIASPALAQEPGPAPAEPAALPAPPPPVPSDSPFPRFYFAFSAGETDFTVDPGQPDEEGASDVGASYRFGYRLRPHVAMEAYVQGFTSITSLFADVFDSADLYPTGNVGVAVRGELPLSGPLSAYGRLGIGRTYFESDAAPEKDFAVTDPSVGVGLLVSPWRRLAFRLDFTRYTRSDIITRQLAAEVRW